MNSNVFVSICFHEHKYTHTRTHAQENTQNHAAVRPTQSRLPHLENPKTKLMPLFFNYLSSHHRHHTKSI